tara:strand:- start:202 stop:348 length:147 start_codon:yes stop_codon:yes gene_type:complete
MEGRSLDKYIIKIRRSIADINKKRKECKKTFLQWITVELVFLFDIFIF